MSLYSNLPEELLHYEVLPRLPIKIVITLKLVCKKWDHLITYDLYFASQQERCIPQVSSSYFICNHGSRIEIQPIATTSDAISLPTLSFSLDESVTQLEIQTVSNGLLLLYSWPFHNGKIQLIVCNTVTKESHLIPHIADYNNYYHRIGIAFDIPTIATPPARYRLAIIVATKGDKEYISKYFFYIFLSDIGQWVKSNQSLTLNSMNSVVGGVVIDYPVYTRGIMYWLTSYYVLWYDLNKNIAGYLVLPDHQMPIHYKRFGMTDEGIPIYIIVQQVNVITIWMMGEGGEWTGSYSFELDILTFHRTSFQFIVANKVYFYKLNDVNHELAYYDMKRKEVVAVKKRSDGILSLHHTFIDYNKLARLGRFS